MKDQRPEGIEHYDQPAGGWGALKAVASAGSSAGRCTGNRDAAKGEPAGRVRLPRLRMAGSKHTSSFEFCENGAKAITWESTAKRSGPEFFECHTVSELWTWTDHALEDAGRLTMPLRYNHERDLYEPIEWNAAFKLIADELNKLDDPNQAEFYTSGRASNEAAFLYQLFVRAYGTNNFPDCSNMCHEASARAR